MLTDRKRLQDRRLAAVQAWSAFVERGDAAETLIRPEIRKSWEPSRQAVHPDVSQAPLADEGDTAETWRDSPLQARRLGAVRGGAARPAPPRTATWWSRSRTPRPGSVDLRRSGDATQGRDGQLRGRRSLGRGSVGTNALAISNRTGNPSMVFSAEHYASIVHNWVCWAAPVLDPATGKQPGSSTCRPRGSARTRSGSRPPG